MVTKLIKALLFHAHSWLGVSRLLQAVHAAGANHQGEFVRWTRTQLLGVLCQVAPILEVPQEEGEVGSDVGNWCECVSLLLPRTGDSSKAVVTVALDAVQQLLSRCEWTADVRLEPVPHRLSDRIASARPGLERGEGCSGDPAPPSQQLVSALVSRLPPLAVPPLVQHLMPAMHDADSRAALSGVDALYLIVQACSDKLSTETATDLISTVFEEVEKVSHSSVRQRVLSCIKVLTAHHFESAVKELLGTGPDFSASSLGALHVIAKEKLLLPKLLNFLTDEMNNADPGPAKRPNPRVQAATVALGHLFTVNDSSIGLVIKKYFPQLFGTFLLRIGTSNEALSAQQTAGSFMNFLHVSQNESMAMALEGNRLTQMSRELFDEVIGELTSLYCRHHPGKREALLLFIKPFVDRPITGHRVSTVTALAHTMASGTDQALGDELISTIVHSLLQCTGDYHATVRKQCMRGLGQLVSLWQQRMAESLIKEDDAVGGKVLPAAFDSLSDKSPAVQREAVLVLHKACDVDSAPPRWQAMLLSCSSHMRLLVDAAYAPLRAASLDLIGKLVALSVNPADIADETQRNAMTLAQSVRSALVADAAGEAEDDYSGTLQGHRVDASPAASPAFVRDLELLLVHCVVRLEDPVPSVAAAAGRSLTHVFSALCAASQSSAGQQAAELLQRREQEGMEFEQFVFPFISFVHRHDRPSLAAQRLETCRTYFVVGSATSTTGPQGGGAGPECAAARSDPATGGSPGHAATASGGGGGGGSSASPTGAGVGMTSSGAGAGAPSGLSTCVAAGFTAVALVRCMEGSTPRPSALLCDVCQDLMDLLTVEDSEFRARVARILGFLDVLTPSVLV